MTTLVKGDAAPRLSTLDPVSRWSDKNTEGLRCIKFADDFLGLQLLPWQKHWLLRALAVDSAGNFRYRTVLTLVGRQSGKTTLLKAVTAFLMFVGTRAHGPVRLVLGAAQDLKIAKEAWDGVVQMAQADPDLSHEIENVRRANGEQELRLVSGSRYMISASSRSAGRGLSVDLLNFDELREQRNFEAWNALSSTTIARPNALILCFSNAGDDESVLLNQMRESALNGADPGVCLMEWSAPDGADIDDETSWALGCPALGHTITVETLRAMRATMEPNGFRTEIMCQRVDVLDEVVSKDGWLATEDPMLSLDGSAGRVMFCLDVSPDLAHVTLCAAVKAQGDRVKVSVVESWPSTEAAVQGLPAHLDAARPHSLGWFSGGPAAAIAADLGEQRHTKVVEIKGADVSTACQGLVEVVASRRLVHSADPLLAAHVLGASRLMNGDGFRFARRHGHCDAAYAAAGAVHLARTVRSTGKPRILLPAA